MTKFFTSWLNWTSTDDKSACVSRLASLLFSRIEKKKRRSRRNADPPAASISFFSAPCEEIRVRVTHARAARLPLLVSIKPHYKTSNYGLCRLRTALHSDGADDAGAALWLAVLFSEARCSMQVDSKGPTLQTRLHPGPQQEQSCAVSCHKRKVCRFQGNSRFFFFPPLHTKKLNSASCNN